MENTNLPKEELSNDTQPDDVPDTQTNDTIPEPDADDEGPVEEIDDQAPINGQPINGDISVTVEEPTGIASQPIMPAYQPAEAPQTDLSVEGQRNGAVDHGEQSAVAQGELSEVIAEPVIPESAFGPMDTIEVNAEDMAVRVMCWHLSASGVLGDRIIVNIADDVEALDILNKEGIPAPIAMEDGTWSVAMGFQSAEGYLTSRVQLIDKNVRLLALRAINYKHSRQDPQVADAMQRYFAHVDQQTKAEVKH